MKITHWVLMLYAISGLVAYCPLCPLLKQKKAKVMEAVKKRNFSHWKYWLLQLPFNLLLIFDTLLTINCKGFVSTPKRLFWGSVVFLPIHLVVFVLDTWIWETWQQEWDSAL